MSKFKRLLNHFKMKDRDLLVLVRTNSTQQSLEEAVECLHKMLLNIECTEVFCGAHELVKRNRITQKSKAILRAITNEELKPFFFFN